MARAYSDPTANTAIANIMREQKRKERQEKEAQQREERAWKEPFRKNRTEK